MIRILIVIFLFLVTKTYSQEIAIEMSRQNIIFAGLDNPFDIVVRKTPNKSLFLKKDNGRIDNNGDNFMIHPIRIGLAKIAIYRISKKDTIFLADKYFKVKSLNSYVKARLGGQSDGIMCKEKLEILKRIDAVVEELDICLTLNILSSRIVVFRGDSLVYSNKINSKLITDDIKKDFSKLHYGDIIYFMDINIISLDKTQFELNPLKFTIE